MHVNSTFHYCLRSPTFHFLTPRPHCHQLKAHLSIERNHTDTFRAPEVHATAGSSLDVWQPQRRRRREKGSGSASVSFLSGSPYWPVKPLWLEQMQMALTCSHEILKAPFKWGPGPQCGSGPALCGGWAVPRSRHRNSFCRGEVHWGCLVESNHPLWLLHTRTHTQLRQRQWRQLA